jgi:hypothetical protein
MSNYTQLDIDNGVIHKVTLCFNPPIPSALNPYALFQISTKEWNFIKSGYAMLKLGI